MASKSLLMHSLSLLSPKLVYFKGVQLFERTCGCHDLEIEGLLQAKQDTFTLIALCAITQDVTKVYFCLVTRYIFSLKFIMEIKRGHLS